MAGDSVEFSSARGHDATDCRALYDAGRLHLFGVNVAAVRLRVLRSHRPALPILGTM